MNVFKKSIVNGFDSVKKSLKNFSSGLSFGQKKIQNVRKGVLAKVLSLGLTLGSAGTHAIQNSSLDEMNGVDLQQSKLVQTHETKKHIVKEGENFWRIAFNNKIPVETLLSYNPDVSKETFLIKPGQIIHLEKQDNIVKNIEESVAEEENIPSGYNISDIQWSPAEVINGQTYCSRTARKDLMNLGVQYPSRGDAKDLIETSKSPIFSKEQLIKVMQSDLEDGYVVYDVLVLTDNGHRVVVAFGDDKNWHTSDPYNNWTREKPLPFQYYQVREDGEYIDSTQFKIQKRYKSNDLLPQTLIADVDEISSPRKVEEEIESVVEDTKMSLAEIFEFSGIQFEQPSFTSVNIVDRVRDILPINTSVTNYKSANFNSLGMDSSKIFAILRRGNTQVKKNIDREIKIKTAFLKTPTLANMKDAALREKFLEEAKSKPLEVLTGYIMEAERELRDMLNQRDNPELRKQEKYARREKDLRENIRGLYKFRDEYIDAYKELYA